MDKKIGFVESTYEYSGEIKSDNTNYLFFGRDLFDDVEIGDVVSFYECENTLYKRAVLVKKLTNKGLKN